jgi:hypothetical protein
MLRNLIRIAVVLLIAHALFRFVPPYIHYHQFKDAVGEAALFSRDRPEAEIVEQVLTLAEKYQIPLERDAVQVTRDARSTYITVAYEEQIEWLPSYTRPMPFTVDVEGWHVQPPTRTEGLR